VTQLAEAFAWCMLQVSVFTLMLACIYLAAKRWRWGGRAVLLLAGLCIVALLTLLCISPWPRWSTLNIDGNLTATTASRDLTTRGANSPPTRVRQPESLVSTERMIDHPSQPDSLEPIDLNSSAATQLHSPAPEAASTRSEHAVPWWVVAVVVAWITCAMGLARFLVALASLWRLRTSSIAIDEPSLLTMFNALSDEVRVKRAVRLRESRSLGVAATCGWRRPMILLPAMWRQWTPDERRAVLAHELAHVREGHYPRSLCSQLAVVAHYYHPLVHWLARQLRFEHEVAADVLAARVFGDSRRYASALAALALGAAPPSGAVGSLGLFMSKPFLMRRLAMLRQDTKQNHGRGKRTLTLSLVLLAGIAIAGVRAGEPPTSGESESQASEAPEKSAPAESTTVSQSAASTAASFVEAPAPKSYVSALFRVSREPERLLGGASSQSDAAWEVFCKTQVALLKSHFVLQAAVQDPEIAALPMLASADDPVGLLAQRLEVGFYPGSEILYVRMALPHTDEATLAKQKVQIVDAVAKAYEEEVVFKDRQRHLSTRDLLAQSQQKLKHEIAGKMEDYHEIALAADAVESGPGQVAQQLDIRRLERIEEELMRLENDFVELQTSGKSGNVKFYEERIAQLSKRQEDLEKKIMSRSQSSVDLAQRRRELEQLQRIADDLSAKLELMDIEDNAPNRIERIQGAVFTSGSDKPAVRAK
jgi:beta-lactamase regulating signal transducer with metallopeptidase domain